MKDDLVQAFRDPPKQFRPSPFWSWNDALKEEELRWQVREMKDKGFGGYFMHSRVGLVTEYLSEEWMKMIGACLDEGKKIGMESWLYDEDKWPSGFAGGLVPEKSRNFRARSIELRKVAQSELATLKQNPDLLAVFSVKTAPDGKIAHLSKVFPWGEPVGEGELLAFLSGEDKESPWFNGETYVDLLNPEVTETFLKVTHEAYAKKFRKDFGEFMPGIFTDEPNFSTSGRPPWTTGFGGYFKEKNGYDLLEKLPYLFYQGNETVKVRHDFWKTVTRRFIEAWTIPLASGCEKVGLQLTGHYLSEDTLPNQVRVIGAAMPHYEYMHVPGIDHLGRNIANPLTLKQLSSAGRQFGRKRLMCEIFGCSGHTMTFEDQKWISDFHFVLGITFLVPHLTLYSMTGERKRDYPPTLSYHQPYWPQYRLINDYLSRCALMMSQGEPAVGILVLHSVPSAWATYEINLEGEDWYKKNVEGSRYSTELASVLDHLVSGHRDFDFGDEFVMERHAEVTGRLLKIGKMKYGLVIVPPSLTWSSNTVGIIKRFLSAGGKVIFVGQIPSMVDAKPSTEFIEMLADPNVCSVLNERNALLEAIDSFMERDVSVQDEEGHEIPDIYCQHRIRGSQHIVFLCSKNRDLAIPSNVSIKAKGPVSEWDAATGEVLPVESTNANGWTRIQTVFPPSGSHIFIIGGPKPKKSAKKAKAKSVEQVIGLHDGWAFKRNHLNSLTLDYCTYSIEGGQWQGPLPVWRVRKEAIKAAGLEPYAGFQPWAIIRKGITAKPIEVRMKFSFSVEDLPKDLSLVVEKPHHYSLTVNGKTVRTDTNEWHWDKQFGKIDIVNSIQKGSNELELSCRYDLDAEIEDVFLVGDFGVKKADPCTMVITREPAKLKDGSWVDQGYPFYSGAIRYQKHFRVPASRNASYVLRLVNPIGTVFLVSLNGRSVGPMWKQPWELDITKAVERGDNMLDIEVISSLRNTFGPLHHRGGDKLPGTGPGDFVTEKDWIDQYQFAAYGLLNGAEILIGR